MADETPCYNFVNPPGTGPIIRVDNGAGNARDLLDFQASSTEVFSISTAGLPDPGGGDAKRTVLCSYGDLPADADLIEPLVHEFEKSVTITNVYIACDTDTATADGGNTQTFTLNRGADSNEICSWATSADPGLTQNTWQSLGAISDETIAADDYVYGTITKAGSGLIVSGLIYRVEYTLL